MLVLSCACASASIFFSSPPPFNASSAQVAEHALHKRMVVGSIPTRGFLQCIVLPELLQEIQVSRPLWSLTFLFFPLIKTLSCCFQDSLPEWSKGVDSSSTSASCVGSNPTAVISISMLSQSRRACALLHCSFWCPLTTPP